jgi:hypothetical protein
MYGLSCKKKIDSPYSSAFTGCGFMLDELVALLPILQADNSDELIKKELGENSILKLGKAKTRQRMMPEFKRRFNAMPRSFWNWFLLLDRAGKTIALYYCLLRSYLLLKDVHLNLFFPRLKSADPSVNKADVVRYILKIAAQDEFVDSWSDATKGRVASSCIAFIRMIGMLDSKGDGLKSVTIDDQLAADFISRGESWYLEALGMPLFEINRIKERM